MVQVPYIQLRQEWARAVALFGRCNGTDYAILLAVADETWGRQKDSVELGVADFARRMAQDKQTIEKTLKKLCRHPDEGGYGMLHVLREATATAPRLLALEEDITCWAWESSAEMERVNKILRSLFPRQQVAIAKRPISAAAVVLARELREHCLGVVPAAEVPDPENPTDATWTRWLDTFQDLLDKREAELLSAVLRFIDRDLFWVGRILGDTADLRLKRNIDTIEGQLRAEAAKRRRKSANEIIGLG